MTFYSPLCYNDFDVRVLGSFVLSASADPEEAEKKERSTYRSNSFFRMATKLYVGGLPYSTTQDELRDTFAKAGAVASASIIMDKMTGRSRGFGFVEMENDADAQKAIEMWNGQDFNGRKLTVNEAKPMEARAPRSNDGGGYGGGNGGGRRSW